MENKIPKKIHLVWLGGERPSKFDTLLDRIKKINVGFEIIEWHDQNINFELINHQLFNDTTNLGSKF